MISENKEWFVFYTKSRCEKKIKDFLLRNNYEVFLPTHKVIRQWSDRKKRVEVPLFNSYIFVRVGESQIHNVLNVPGIVKNLRYNGTPGILRDFEYLQLTQWLETGLPFEVEDLGHDFQLGARVKVLEGMFEGISGDVYKKGGDSYCIAIESLQQVLSVKLRKEFLKLSE
jgi:transcription antitermination factor NusG